MQKCIFLNLCQSPQPFYASKSTKRAPHRRKPTKCGAAVTFISNFTV